MKTRGEIEAAICVGMGRFEQEYMGRGPKDINAHLVGDLLIVRLKGVLTAAEQQLLKDPAATRGRSLVKEMRSQLIESARPILSAIVLEAAGVPVVSLHCDISTVTGEKMVVFTLAEAPLYRETKKSQDPVLYAPMNGRMLRQLA